MKKYLVVCTLVVGLLVTAFLMSRPSSDKNDFVTYRVDLAKQDLKLYWKDDQGRIIKSIAALNALLTSKGQRLIFAANAGMFRKDYSPQGLLVQNRKIISPLDTLSGSGNFYLKPNGVFYITEDNKAAVCKTEEFKFQDKILYATQSGPMLITEGVVHPAFKQNSGNVNIRNGVGILPDGRPVFAMSKNKVNFYEFAVYFKKIGCRDALYLDGFVSRTYLPEKNWIQLDGSLGVIVGVASRK